MMNKAFALEVNTEAEVCVFLDSDQVCYAALELSDLAVPMIGRKVFYPGAQATHNLWERAYEVCEATMPRHRILVRSRVASEAPIVSPPCFNSGIISVHRAWVYDLVASYIDCFERINQHNLLGENRYFTEQMALAIAVVKSGVPNEIDNHRFDSVFFTTTRCLVSPHTRNMLSLLRA